MCSGTITRDKTKITLPNTRGKSFFLSARLRRGRRTAPVVIVGGGIGGGVAAAAAGDRCIVLRPTLRLVE